MAAFEGRYRILERLGFGGMAEVFLAVATGAAGFERTVVVKRLLPQMAEDELVARSFLDEARLLAKLHHPHIAQVLDLGESADGTYLVMEHIDGTDLRGMMERLRRPLDAGLAAYVVRDVCEALDYGFTRVQAGVPLKLIHRDVSLSNIMISRAGVVKLVDFGLAKALTGIDRQHTASGIVKGKWSYLAPEVLQGQPADHKSDIFSAGVVLFELACGRKLYRPTQLLSEMLAERAQPLPRIEELQPEAADLAPVLARALAMDPAARWQRAEEMAAALDEVVHARRVRPPQLGELMANLLDPARLRATQSMNADQLGASERIALAAATAAAVAEPTPPDRPLGFDEDDPPETQVTPQPLLGPDTDQTPASGAPLDPEAPKIPRPPASPMPGPPRGKPTVPGRPVKVPARTAATPPFAEPETVISTRLSRSALAGVPRWMIFSTVGVVAALLVVTLLVLLIK
jgi:serine/threonine-protein kinase